MVFVWSTLTNGNPAYTVVQVATNDLIILIAFVPIVQLADRTSILCKGSFSVYIIAIRLLLNHSPSEWFSLYKKRDRCRSWLQRLRSPYLRVLMKMFARPRRQGSAAGALSSSADHLSSRQDNDHQDHTDHAEDCTIAQKEHEAGVSIAALFLVVRITQFSLVIAF